jgi:exonuclease III
VPQGTITRSDENSETTIDLVLASPPLKNTLESCRVREDHNHGSDHKPNFSVSSFGLQLCRFESSPL